MQLYFNGKFISEETDLPIVRELSFLRGFAIFDFFGVRSGIPLFIEDYLNRFYQSARLVGLDVPIGRSQLRKDIEELIAINHLKDAYCKIILSGGYSPDGFRPGPPNIYIMPQKMTAHPPERYTQGVTIITDDYKREIPEVKTTNYMNAVMKIPKMEAANAIEVLYHDNDLIRECSRCNFFLVKDNVISTPATDILKGITRKQIIELARNTYTLLERDITLDEIVDADEIFITSTTKILFPVVKIDNQVIGNGLPGSISLDLLDKMKKRISEYVDQRR